MVLNGAEWRPSDIMDVLNGSSQARVGVITARRTGDSKFYVTFSPVNVMHSITLFGALLGNGLESNVKYGVNSGSTLRHEFVVLALVQLVMKPESNHYAGALTLNAPKGKEPKCSSFALWVTNGVSQCPIQVIGGDL